MATRVAGTPAPGVADTEDLGHGYRIDFLGPHRWRLVRRSREIGVYGAASEARNAARRHAVRHRLGRRAAAHLGVALAGALVLIAVQPFADVANPAADRARTFADRMDDAFRAVRDATERPADFTLEIDGFAGAVVPVPTPTSGATAETAAATREMLVGAFEGDCYVVRWVPGGPVTTGVVAPDLACLPGPALTHPDAFVRSSVATTGDTPIWAEVLPPDTTRARWYLPAVIGAVLLVVDGSIGATVAAIRRGRGG